MKNNDAIINIDSFYEDDRIKQSEQSLEECILTLSEKLELANNLLTTLLETTHEFIIFGLDSEYRYLSFNNRHKEIAKSQWGADIGIGMKILDIIDNQNERENIKKFFDRVLLGEQFSSVEEYNDTNDTILLGKSHWAPVKNNNGEITGLVCFIEDVTEKNEFLKEMLEERKNQDTIESLTFCDQLTGAYNRKFYEKELSRLDDQAYYPLSIILLKINCMNKVNNQYGRAVGDILMKKVAQILQNDCRGDDVVARLENDEFVILMPRTEGGKVERAIKRIKSNLDEIKVKSIKLDVPFGFCTKYEESEDTNAVFKTAGRHLERQRDLK